MKKTQIIMAITLCVTLGAGAAITSWDEDFTGLSSLPTDMTEGTASGSGTTTVGGGSVNWSENDYRSFIGVGDQNYRNEDFTAYATVFIESDSNGGAGGAYNSVYFGITDDYDCVGNMPQGNGCFMGIDARATGGSGANTYLNQGTVGENMAAGGVIGVGTHRLKMVWDASETNGTFSIDVDNSGTSSFTADYSGEVSTATLTGTTYLFFGGGSGCEFDNISVAAPPPPPPPGQATIMEMSFDTGVKIPTTVLYADDFQRSDSSIGTTSTGGYSWDESGETNVWAFKVDGWRLVSNGHDSFAGAAHVHVGYDLDTNVHYKAEMSLSVYGKYGDVWTAIMPRASGSGINEDGWRFRLPDKDPGLALVGVGTNRLQMVWDAATETGTFGVDTNYTGGTFVADLTLVLAHKGFEPGSDARLFFGGGSGCEFDDISVTGDTSWSEDFTGLTALPSNMEKGAANLGGNLISVGGGTVNWSETSDRQFVRTTATNYCNLDFTFEGTVYVQGDTSYDAVFFGMGEGDCLAWVPDGWPSLSSCIDPRAGEGYKLVKDDAFQVPDPINVSFYNGTETAALGSFPPREDVKVAMDVDGSSATLTITDVSGTTTYVSDTRTVANAANDSNADYVGFAHTLDSEDAYIDNLVVSVEGDPVVGTTNYVKLTVNAPSGAASCFPEAATDMVISNWAHVAHSANGVDGFAITNLGHSTVDGTNVVIYLQGTNSVEFFRIITEE